MELIGSIQMGKYQPLLGIGNRKQNPKGEVGTEGWN